MISAIAILYTRFGFQEGFINMEKVIVPAIKCGMKLLIHSLASKGRPFKFG